jgi:hypothetical protein
VPNDRAEFGHVSEGASQTLEYAIDDFTISTFADSLGQRDTAKTFAHRAQNWQNVFDPGTCYPRPKDSQGAFPAGPGFVAPSAGQFGQDGFDEGNAAQYNFLMPQNMAGLINAMGGRDAVNKRADSFFQQFNAGPNAPNQWSGNEIDFAAPWLYDYTGQPWKTQDVVRRIETELFAGSWSLEYDSSDPAQRYKSTPPVARTNTDTWKKATFVDDAGFTGRQNSSADFRLSSNGGGGTIARVHVAVSGDNVLALRLFPTDQ